MMRRRLLVCRAALLGGSAALALHAGAMTLSAQDAYIDDDEYYADEEAFEEVAVTGSRIKNANISSPSPVTTVSGVEIDARGIVKIEDLLNSLPQAFAAAGSGNFGGAGTATVNLRGLGQNRTLVLVDGRRLPFGQSNQTAPDLNQIPAQLVERVEVLTGGASAVYGADAVSGVVNFIMKRDFEGFEIEGTVGIFQTGNKSDRFTEILRGANQPVPGAQLDGFTWDTSVIYGADLNDGRGNLTAYFTYRDVNEIRQADRIFSACQFGGGSPEYYCLGSSTTNPARIASFGLAAISQFDLLAYDPETGVTRNYVGGGTPNDTFNFAATQRTTAPNERYTLGAMAHYDITDSVEAYLDFTFSSNQQEGQIGPSGNFNSSHQINCDNPFLSEIQLDEICTKNGLSGDDIAYARVGRRNVEGGPRQYRFTNQTFRITAGVRGDLSDTWGYDVFGQYSRVTNTRIVKNDIVIERVQRSLLVVNDADGNPVCKSVLSGVDPACVPWNVFQPDGVTQAALDYISVPGSESGVVNQKVLSATLTGDLGHYGVVSPWAYTGVQVITGFEYHSDTLNREVDDLIGRGQLAGGGTTLPIAGKLTTWELFGEVAIPLVEGAELAEQLSLTGAIRFSDYNTTGPQVTYSFGIVWQPVSDIHFRAQYQRATRAPNVFELFFGQTYSLFDLSDPDGDGIYDPCAGAAPYYSASQCANMGVTAAQYGNIIDNPVGQFNNKVGGNEDLKPETSATYTLGVVITPSLIDGLVFSADYFDISVGGAIGAVPSELAINKCATTADEFYCSLIQRDGGGGLFVDSNTSYVVATNINTGSLKTTGIDINADYSFGLSDGWGSISVKYTGTYVFKLQEIPLPGESVFECSGFYSGDCHIAYPKYNHRMLTTWSAEADVNVNLIWRHVGSVTLFNSPATSTNQNRFLGAQEYIDISANFSVSESTRIRIGINNVFDNQPPVTNSLPAGLGTGNTIPSVWDVGGRYGFVGFTASF